MSAQRLVISGYYGYGNTGDEAVLAGILAGLRRIAPEVVPVVLTNDPTGTAALHQVAVAQRGQPGVVLQTLRQANALLSGGGSLLQDVTSRRSVYYYLGVMGMARLSGRPFCVYGQGVGPLQAPAARKATAVALRGSRGIWVRDQESAHLVHELISSRKTVIKSCPVEVTGDAAFLLTPPGKEQARRVLRNLSDANGCPAAAPIWLVAVRPWEVVAGWESPLLQGVVPAAVAAGATLGFIGMQADVDQSLAEKLYAEVTGKVPAFVVAPGNLHSVREILAGADLVVAMRLHALILAAAAGVPGVAISYDPKVTALAAELSLPVQAVEELVLADGSGVLSTLIRNAWQNRETAGERIRTAAQLRSEKALAGLRSALQALGLPTASI